MRAGSLVACASLVLVAGLAGCSSGGGPVVPDGWQQVSEGGLRMAVPADWVGVDGPNDTYSVAWVDDEDDPSVWLIASPAAPVDDAQGGLDLFMVGGIAGGLVGFSSQSGGVVREDSGLDVQRDNFTWGEDEGQQDGVFWSAAVPDKQPVVLVMLRSMNDDPLDEDLVSGIENSIDVVPTDD